MLCSGVQCSAFRKCRRRHFKETGSDIDDIFTLLLPIYVAALLSPSANVHVKGEINSLSSEDSIRARARLLNSHFVALLTRYRGNTGLLHYIIATVMCHKYLVVHKGINSVCKYLSAARRERNLHRGEKTTREIGDRWRFGSVRVRCRNRRSQRIEAYRARAVAHERNVARLDLCVSSNHLAFAFPRRELP